MDTLFTEKQLKLLREALRIAAHHHGVVLSAFGRSWEIDALKSDLEDLLQFERERKAQRRKSLAIEKRASRNA